MTLGKGLPIAGQVNTSGFPKPIVNCLDDSLGDGGGTEMEENDQKVHNKLLNLIFLLYRIFLRLLLE